MASENSVLNVAASSSASASEWSASPKRVAPSSTSSTPISPHSSFALDKRAVTEASLWWWNLACALAHGVQAVAALTLSLAGPARIRAFKLPLTTVLLDWSGVAGGGYPVQALKVQALLPFAGVTSGFAWMSCAAHVVVLCCFSVYLTDLRKGINRFRWIEYAFSSSLMIGLIAMLFGVYDIFTLVGLTSVNACMCLFGYLQETTNQFTPKTDWMPFVFGGWGAVGALARQGQQLHFDAYRTLRLPHFNALQAASPAWCRGP